MQKSTETSADAAIGADVSVRGAPSAAGLSPEVQAAREHIRERLQAEVDNQGALAEARRAAALIGESSIRFTGESDTDFVIVGPDGQARASLNDGRSEPFSLRDLAAELRRNYPALFKPDAPAAAVAAAEPIEAAPPSRDWLMLGPSEASRSDETSRPGAPAASADMATNRAEADANAAAPAAPALPRAAREPATFERPGLRQSFTAAIPDMLPTIGGFRPSYAIYGGLAFMLGVLLALMFWGLRSEPSPGAAPAQEARAGAASAPASTPAPAGQDKAKPPGPLSGVPEIVDTSTLSIDGRVVRLFGVEWERGAQSDDLIRYIAGREVVCTPAVRSDRHRCQLAGRDLSEVVLFNGGGRATAEATPELKAAEAKARAAGFGIWQKP